MKKMNNTVKIIIVSILAVSIPGLLILNSVQATKCRELEKSISELETKQENLVTENKKLIKDISVLSSSDRIEDIAKNELNMREAESSEIVRVEITGKENGK